MTFEFDISLDLLTPKVWRKVVVNDSMTFHQFHQVIQICMGWDDFHMYQFSPKGFASYPCIEEDHGGEEMTAIKYLREGLEAVYDAKKAKLKDFFKSKGGKINYIYDFGDSWVHKITLKKVHEGTLVFAMCIDGAGACPPEDCGGVWGYDNILKTIADPTHPEYKEMREWMGLEEGEEWDINYLDKIMVNRALMDMGKK